MRRKKEPQLESAIDPISHDAYFRKNFSDVNLARNYLETFLQPDVLNAIDLSTLHRDDTSYVDERYKKMYSDVVYQADLKASGGKTHALTISFLFEHKSRQPANIFLQLLSYILQVWQRCAQEKQPLSFVLPIVVYHGRKAWRTKPLSGYFKGLPSVFEQYLPSFNYHITDLASTPTSVLAALQNQFFLQHVLAALKFAGQNAATDAEFALLLVSNKETEAQSRVKQTLVYLFSHLPETEHKRIELIVEQKQSDMTTIYQSLVNKGKQEGIEEGKLEGKLEGILEGKELTLAILRQVLKFPAKSDAQIALELGCDKDAVAEVRATLK